MLSPFFNFVKIFSCGVTFLSLWLFTLVLESDWFRITTVYNWLKKPLPSFLSNQKKKPNQSGLACLRVFPRFASRQLYVSTSIFDWFIWIVYVL